MSRLRSMPVSLRVFVCLLVSLTLGCRVTERICIWLGYGYPYDYPLLPYIERFQDIGLYREQFTHYHSRLFYDITAAHTLYPAPATILYKLLFLSGHAGVALVLFSVFAIAGFLMWFAHGLTARGLSKPLTVCLALITAICSYPFAFEFRQGNIEIFIWAFTASSLALYLRKRYLPAAILIGVLAAMKLYPIALLGLLLARKRYREIIVAVAVSTVATVAGLWLACPDLAYSWRRTQDGIAEFQRNFTLHQWAIGHDHSLFALIKKVLDVMADRTGRSPFDVNASALHIYLPIAGLLGFALCFVVIRKLPVVNQILCILAAMILLPPTSYDYTLMHLYLPWALLTFYALERKGETSRALLAAMVCFAVLFAPESEFIYHYIPLGGQIKALALAGLIGIAMRVPFQISLDEWWKRRSSTQSLAIAS